MPKPSKDILYEMAVNHLRHFGGHATKLRHIALIQSYTVIAGAVYLFIKEHYIFAALAGLFGGLMMFVMFAIHWNFLSYYKDIQDYVRCIETDSEFSGGLVEYVEDKRNVRIKSLLGWFAINGVFVVIIIIMLMIAVYGFYISLSCNTT